MSEEKKMMQPEEKPHYEFAPIPLLTPEQIEKLKIMNQQVEEPPEYVPVPPEMQLSAPMMFEQSEPACWEEAEYQENDIDAMIGRAKAMAQEAEKGNKMPEMGNDLER